LGLGHRRRIAQGIAQPFGPGNDAPTSVLRAHDATQADPTQAAHTPRAMCVAPGKRQRDTRGGEAGSRQIRTIVVIMVVMTSKLEAERPEHYLKRLAASDLGRAYKSLVIDEMRVHSGAFVVDLGCGPGIDLPGFAIAVGPSGRVLGIDNDRSAVTGARHVASRFPWVGAEHGDIHRVELADQSVDRVHTDRVLQHVADPPAVIGEVQRVLVRGGVAGFAEPDWDTLVIDYPDSRIPVAYRRFITEQVVRNARIGREIPALCESAGLIVARVVPVTAVFRDVARADQVFGFERVTHRAVASNYLTDDEANAWLSHLQSGQLFASVTLFLTVAEGRSGG
jgi:SAM-dependent methyltransferase